MQVMRKADLIRKNMVQSVQMERNILAMANNPFVVRSCPSRPPLSPSLTKVSGVWGRLVATVVAMSPIACQEMANTNIAAYPVIKLE